MHDINGGVSHRGIVCGVTTDAQDEKAIREAAHRARTPNPADVKSRAVRLSKKTARF
jgi:hypothetical protein